MSLKREPTIALTFPELPEAEADHWLAQMPGHSTLTFSDRLTYAAYRDIPSTYLLCEEDKLITPDAQRAFIERLREEGGREVDVQKRPYGHAINVTAPEVYAQVIRHAAGEEGL